MARHYFGMNRNVGETVSGRVTTDTSSTGLEIEVSTLDGSGITRKDVVDALRRISDYILLDTQITGGVNDIGQ